MISHERLCEAAQQAEKALLASLPDPEECKATFSPGFERKMKKLVKRTDHPIAYWVQKSVASFLLIVLLGGGSVLALSTEARAAFVGWVQEIYETWFVYQYSGKKSESDSAVYQPSWLPDGFVEISSPNLYEQQVTVYEDEDSSLLIFGYSQSAGAMDLYVSREDAIIRQATVWGNSAELYLYPKEDAFTCLVWTDDDSGLIFWIVANLDESSLLQIAENITKIK